MDFKKLLYTDIPFKPSNGVTLKHVNSNTISNNHNYNSTSNYNNNIDNGTSNNINNANSINNNLPHCEESPPIPIKLAWSAADKVGGGLINIGNTCFLNSVLQCLTYCPPLYHFLDGHSQKCNINAFCMLCEMEKHVKKMKSSNGLAIRPSAIHQRLQYINRSFQFGRQEDAHEFLRYLIDHMWKACLMNLNLNVKISKIDPKIKETTMINHIFGGYFRSQVMCLTCKYRSNTFDFFMDFVLDIRNVSSLDKALDKFTQPEILQHDNAYKCAKCQKKVSARKRFTVYKAPNVATFQLKRFDSDRIFGGKITKHINYPDEFDLRPYMSESNKPPIRYKLSAVLVHVGHTSNSGHYYCFIKNSDNFWYRMDDSNVSQVSRQAVLDQQAYVLFYTRCDVSSAPTNGNSIKSEIIKPSIVKADLIKQPQQINAGPNKEIEATLKTSSLSTWFGSKSQLDERDDSSNKRKLKDDLDEFNEDLDRGKTKKIKARIRENKFGLLSKSNQFQNYNNNGYSQHHRNDSFPKKRFSDFRPFKNNRGKGRQFDGHNRYKHHNGFNKY